MLSISLNNPPLPLLYWKYRHFFPHLMSVVALNSAKVDINRNMDYIVVAAALTDSWKRVSILTVKRRTIMKIYSFEDEFAVKKEGSSGSGRCGIDICLRWAGAWSWHCQPAAKWLLVVPSRQAIITPLSGSCSYTLTCLHPSPSAMGITHHLFKVDYWVDFFWLGFSSTLFYLTG